MPRMKKETTIQSELSEPTESTVVKKTTRTRKKKTAELVVTDTDKEITVEEQNRIDFDSLQPSGLMRYKASDYEQVHDGLELCTRHLEYLIHKTENNVLAIGVLLIKVELFHKYIFSDAQNASYEARFYEFDKGNCAQFGTGAFFERKYFKDIYDYAAYYLGLSRGTTSNYMNLVRRFACSEISIITGQVDLTDKYSCYTPSQLVQLLPYSDEEIENALNERVIMPGMSCRMIAKCMKSEYRLSANNNNRLSDGNNRHILNKQLADDVNSVLNDMNDFEVSQYGADNVTSNTPVGQKSDDVSSVTANTEWDASNIKITSLDTLPDYSYFEQVFNSYIKNGYEIELIAVKKQL